MSIFNDCLSGPPMLILPNLRRKLSAYTRVDRAGNFKIGITNDPLRRLRGYAGMYSEMILLYCSNSIRNVSLVECELIEHNQELTDNLIAGGGGRFGAPPYYLYVVLG